MNAFLSGYHPAKAATSGRAKSDAQRSFKALLKENYNQTLEGTLIDMATGYSFPQHTVTASHIYPRDRRQFLSDDSRFTDIYHVRNGLLLYKPVEVAFDQKQLCVEVDEEKQYKFYLLDETLRTVKLVDAALPHFSAKYNKSVTGGVDLQTTFGDLDGRLLTIPEATELPSKALLAIHAVSSWRHQSQGSNRNVRFPEFNSSDDGKAENVIHMYELLK